MITKEFLKEFEEKYLQRNDLHGEVQAFLAELYLFAVLQFLKKHHETR